MRGLLLAAVFLGVAQSAYAADMPDLPFLRGSLPDGISTRTVWQGYYVGGQAAVGESDMNFTGATSDIAAKMLANTAMESSGDVSSWPVGSKTSVRGNAFGGFVGYNSQWDDVVIGVEANYLHGKFNGSQTDSMSRSFVDSNGYTDGVTYAGTASYALSDFGSLRVRAGYAIGSFLPYMFAGVGLGQADIVRTASISATEVNTSAATGFTNLQFNDSVTDAKNSHLVYGYSAGVGVDVMLMAGLFLRAEYQYLRLTSSIDTDVNTVQVGLGYKF